MVPSIEGFLVAAFLLFVGYLLGSPLIIGLFTSLAFGATSYVTLTALGGSSPLIYTLFAAGIVLAAVMRKKVLQELAFVFTRHKAAWIVLFLMIYTIISAVLFPRLFAGQTTAFVPVVTKITELPLMPVSGNITQTAYFTLGTICFFAFSIFLQDDAAISAVRRGFFAFAVANAALGLIDIAGKVVGAGDILSPIRTASYSLLTDVEQAGFWRIAGGYAEASAFGGTSLICLAFVYTYWRKAHSTFAFALTVLLLILLLLSTSSTAYVGLVILSLVPLASIFNSAIRNEFRLDDFLLIGIGLITLTFVLALFLYDEVLFEPVIDLFQTTILDKPLSESGLERAYWNTRSIDAFLDTSGVGIGMGSSRSSSWIISVLAQLGIVGALAIMSLVFVIFRGMWGLTPTAETLETFALAAAVRAAIVASLLAACIAGSGADPGILFFVALSVVSACRYRATEGSADSDIRLSEARLA